MGFVFIRKDVLDGCAGNSHSLAMDLHDQHVYMEKTGAVALHAADPRGRGARRGDAPVRGGGRPAGAAARATRANCEALVDGMKALGFAPFLDPAIQAPIIVTFHAPADPAYDVQARSTTRVKTARLHPLSGQAHRRSRRSASAASARSGPTEMKAAVAAVAGDDEGARHRQRRAEPALSLGLRAATTIATMTTPTPEHPALTAVRKSGSSKVKVAVSDIDGILRGKYLHIDKFLGAAEPTPAAASASATSSSAGTCADQTYDNTTLTGWQHGFPDALARLDLATQRNVPWDGNVPFFLGEFVNADHTPSPICPRQTLKRVLARAEKMGFTADVRDGVRVVQLRRDAADAGPPSRASARSRSRRACSATRCCA